MVLEQMQGEGSRDVFRKYWFPANRKSVCPLQDFSHGVGEIHDSDIEDAKNCMGLHYLLILQLTTGSHGIKYLKQLHPIFL